MQKINLEHPFFKKQRSIKAFKAFRDESSLAYHAQKDDPAVAELDAALMSCPDELAGAAPYRPFASVQQSGDPAVPCLAGRGSVPEAR